MEIYLTSSSPKVHFIDILLNYLYTLLLQRQNMARKGKINRKTKETSISVEANLDGSGSYKINTKIGLKIIEIISHFIPSRFIFKAKT